MRDAQLFQHVPPEHIAEVERLYDAFVAASRSNPESSIDGFANAIHEMGLIEERGLHDFLTYRSLTIGTIEQTTAAGSSESRVQPMTMLSHGAMGEVFLGRDPNLKRTVAVKRVHTDLRADPLSMQRFLTEAQVTAQLDHPAIVPIYGFEKDDDGSLNYAMKYVRGVTLTAYLAEARRQRSENGRCDATHSLKARIETFVPVLNAIAYAHRRGVIHRDLKPDNIMVGSFGEVLVMDWGIARVIGHPDPIPDTEGVVLQPLADTDGKQRTLVGTIIGTPSYMSPEQAAGVDLDAASDQYSLGLVLQEVVTLSQALNGDTIDQLFLRALLGEREPLTAARDPVPRELRAIIVKATAKGKAERYASVQEMAEDVHRFLRDESVLADPDRGLRRVGRWVGRNRGLAMALGGALLILSFAVVALVLWQGQIAVEAEREASRQREQKMTAVGALVDAQARRMSAKLSRYEASVSSLAATIAIVRSEPARPSDVVPYTYRDHQRQPAELPVYAVPSERYGQPASLRQADFSVAYTADLVALRPVLDQLARITPTLRHILLSSAGHEAAELPLEAAEELVLKQGVPVTWTYFGSSEGILVGMPGTWDYANSGEAKGYDCRLESWYKEAIARREPRWTSSIDETGAGLLLNCGLTVRSADGEVLGVASLDLWPGPFIAEMMESPTLTREGVESMILDDRLRVLVRTSEKAAARDLAEHALAPYEDANVRAAISARGTGHMSRDGRLAVWNAIGNAGLTYLVVGPETTLLDASH